MSRLAGLLVVAACHAPARPAPPPSSGIAGVLIDDTGTPRPNATVWCRGAGVPHTTITDRAGHFRFALPPGHYRLDDDGNAVTIELTLAPDERVEGLLLEPFWGNFF